MSSVLAGGGLTVMAVNIDVHIRSPTRGPRHPAFLTRWMPPTLALLGRISFAHAAISRFASPAVKRDSSGAELFAIVARPSDHGRRYIGIVYGSGSATSPPTSAPKSAKSPRCRPPAGDNVVPCLTISRNVSIPRLGQMCTGARR
jgi:hypothetical protein